MTDNIIIGPFPQHNTGRRDDGIPVAKVRIGPDQHFSIKGITAAEVGTPLVEFFYPGGIINLKPERAVELAEALAAAVKRALE